MTPLITSKVSGASQMPHGREITRRDMLIGTCGLALLGGCGSGGGSISGFRRSAITGDLRSQFELFAKVGNSVALGWQGSSAAWDDGKAYFATRGGRSVSDGVDTMRTVMYTMNALKDAYQRTAQVALKLDDLGHVGDAVTAANNLSGDTSLSNPQYMAAMLERHYQLMRAICGMNRTMSLVGLTPFINNVKATTDPYEKVVAYSIMADTFNEWVKTLFKTSKQTLDPTLLLAMDATINPDSVEAQMSRVPGIVARLPVPTGPPDAPSRHLLDYDHMTSYLGTFAELYLTLPEDIAKHSNLFVGMEKFEHGIRRLASDFRTNPHIQTPFLQAAKTAAYQDLAFKGVGYLLENGIGGENGIMARCALELGKAAFDTVTMGLAAVATSVSFLGAVVYGALAVNSAYSFYTAAQKCADDLLKEQAKRIEENLKKLDDSYRRDGQLPIGRNVTVLSSSLEWDQIKTVYNTFRRIQAPEGFNPIIDPIDPDIERETLAKVGAPGSGITCEQAENAFIKLMADYVRRNKEALTPVVSPSNEFAFAASSISMMVVREPGVTQVTVPSITDAQLLCAGTGFIPKRGDADLTTMTNLPDLEPLPTTFGLGVKVNAK